MKTMLLTVCSIVFFFTHLFAQDPDIVWQNTIGGDRSDDLITIRYTPDGGSILGGYSTSSASSDKAEGTIGGLVTAEDFWIVKLDSAGNIIWQNTIGGNGE